MELTATQKISLQLAIAARLRELEGLEGAYVVKERIYCRELAEIFNHAMTVDIKSYSGV
ncbi:hypothetical protein [Acrocarpospora sp. B8E8]|uniref:hypothetical protein n=1 Tax=Acrocarpospora sp. B8E8 TaxID=3153572 RepID=UPI00325EFA66